MSRITSLLARRRPVVNLLASDQTVLEAVRTMAERCVGAVLVSQNGRLVGIFSEQDVVRRVLAKGRDPQTVALADVMTPAPVTAVPEDGVEEAIAKMQNAHCRHLPVLVGGQPADTLSMRDLMTTGLEEREREVEDLQSYIRGEGAE